MSLQDDPRDRYKIENVTFAEDLGSIVVDFIDPAHQGPVIQERTQWAIDLRSDDEMRQIIFAVFDQICDVMDRAHVENRAAKL